MSNYCIMRVEKRKRSALYGLQIEANRTTADHENGRNFAASDICWELTDFNMFLVKSENWNKAVTAALKAAINANAKADAATKEALTALIQQAQETLQQAIATGDKALEEKIAALEIAMNNALAANAAADEELTVLIQSGLAVFVRPLHRDIGLAAQAEYNLAEVGLGTAEAGDVQIAAIGQLAGILGPEAAVLKGKPPPSATRGTLRGNPTRT